MSMQGTRLRERMGHRRMERLKRKKEIRLETHYCLTFRQLLENSTYMLTVRAIEYL